MAREYFLNPNINNIQIELKQSSHAIASIYEPRYMTVEGFMLFYRQRPMRLKQLHSS